jgi:hypothetical protein
MTARSDFWSRRKAAVHAEETAEHEAKALAEIEDQRSALEEKPDAEILQNLNLPDPDDLQPGDDFSAFLKVAVPERLRRRALRKLWLSNPLLANVDGLVDYGEDFTDSAMVVESMQTAYQVGKGMLKHVEALAAQAEAEALDEDEGDEADGAREPTLDPQGNEVEVEVAEAPATLAELPTFDDEIDEVLALSPRRMRFSFADDTAQQETRGQA